MGVFHCPLGAASLGSDECVGCGLCTARTREEFRAASVVVRKHLRAASASRLEQYLIQKIAVCGKGGVGKSTLTALVAQSLEDLGYEVLVVDTDESNPGLGRKLGITTPPKPMSALLGGSLAGFERIDREWLSQEQITLEDIPDALMARSGAVRFLTAGKISESFQGCACSMSDLVRDLLVKLSIGDRQVVVVDNEAGVESFGRGLERGADTVLAVVEPTMDSVELTNTIRYMAEGFGIRRVRAILNRVPTAEVEERLCDELADRGIRFLGALPFHQKLLLSGLDDNGHHAESSPLLGPVRRLTRLMLDEAEMSYELPREG